MNGDRNDNRIDDRNDDRNDGIGGSPGGDPTDGIGGRRDHLIEARPLRSPRRIPLLVFFAALFLLAFVVSLFGPDRVPKPPVGHVTPVAPMLGKSDAPATSPMLAPADATAGVPRLGPAVPVGDGIHDASAQQYDDVRIVAYACPQLRPIIRRVLAAGPLSQASYTQIGDTYARAVVTAHRIHAAAEARHAVGIGAEPNPVACSKVYRDSNGTYNYVFDEPLARVETAECRRTAGAGLANAITTFFSCIGTNRRQ